MEPIKLNWPGGEHDFLLRIGELEALDDLTPAGTLDYLYRLSLGQARGSLTYAPINFKETRNCIRLALIGGGMKREDAERIEKQGFIDGDIGELNLLAFTIISNSLRAKEHDALGEDQAVENPPE